MTPLAPDEIALTWLDVRPVPEERIAGWLSRLDEQERNQAGLFRHSADRRAYIAAHFLRRALLAAFLACPPEQLRWRQEAGGRPELASGDPLRFSLSRTRSLVACAASADGALGLDIETEERARDSMAIAYTCFTPEESALVHRGGMASFLRLWTLKEAFLKATGVGLQRPLDSFSFALDPIRIVQGASHQDWRFAQFSPQPGHWIALALQTPATGGPPPALRILTPETLERTETAR